MNIQESIDLATQMERKMSECYEELSQFCDDESISKELMELSKEEIDHMNLLIAGKNYVSEAPKLFELKFDREVEMKEGLNRVMILIDKIKNKRVRFAEAINDTFELEKLFEQLHLKTIIEVNDASLKNLFKALSLGDKEHEKRLIEILKRLY
jgi:rubrerythrin